MSQESKSESGPSLRRLLLRIGATLALLLVLYVLSTGPAVYYGARQRWKDEDADFWLPMNRIYAPIAWIHDTPAGYYFYLYLRWWIDLAQRGNPLPYQDGTLPSGVNELE